MKIKLQKPPVFVFPLSIVIALLLIGVLARPQSTTFSYFYARVEFGEGWKTSLVLVNIGHNASNVRLLSYDVAGTLLKETGISPALMPGERRDYPKENGAWPEGTASLKVVSEGSLYSYLMLESTDGGALEAIMAVADPATTLTFPLVTGGSQSWSQLSLLNVGSEQAMVQAVALDPNGHMLATAQLSPLSPMGSSTVTLADLFDSAVIGSSAAVQVIANKPLAGVQVFGTGDGKDVAAVTAPLTEGQELFLPVFQEAEGVPLWATVGLFNPRDGPVRVDVEAFDANHNSLGFLTDLTFLPSQATHLFQTANIGGKLPSETASLRIIADQPIKGYAVIGALNAKGLTAVGAVTENDSAPGYELVGSNDGNLLAAMPLVTMANGTALSPFWNGAAGYWKKNVSRSSSPTEVSALRGSGELSQSLQSTADHQAASAAAAGTFQWPLSPSATTPRITQDYACRGTSSLSGTLGNCYSGTMYHTGIDMTPVDKTGTDCATVDCVVYSADAGVVQAIPDQNDGWGNVVIIDHQNGLYSQYAHLKSFSVANGYVGKGTQIGIMGQTGCPQPCVHLHFEIKTTNSKGAGYTLTPPSTTSYGYKDPWSYISSTTMSPVPVRIVSNPYLNVRRGPGLSGLEDYAIFTTVNFDQVFVAFAQSTGWYRIHLPCSNSSCAGWIAGTLSGTTYSVPDSSVTQVEVKNTGIDGLNVRSEHDTSTALNILTKIWDGQRFVSFETFPAGSGCDKTWHRIYLPANANASSGWVCSGLGGVDFLTEIPGSGQTLSVSLTAYPTSGTAPLSSNLTADVSGTATGDINYTFWWNCNDPGTSVSTVTSMCGDPTNSTIGAKFDGVNDDPKTVSHTYSAGVYTAKVIAERGSAPPAEARVSINVTPPPPTLLSPANGTTFASGTTSVPLHWSFVSGATGYDVEVSTGSCGGTFFGGITTSSTSWTVIGLSDGQTYFWRVRSVGTAGPSPYSSCFSFSINAATFNYSLSNSGNITVTQGSSNSNTIGATLVSGSSQSVSFAASGLPSGATASFSPTSCSPTCSSTLTISTSASAPVGTYPITVTGSPLGRSTSFNLVVNPAPAGSLQFSSSSYSVNENGGPAVITVTRTGGSNGAVGVTLTTSNGTAQSGSDYTAVNQTVSFANGDTVSKTVNVPITNDSSFEGNETVNLALSSPTGGATLGSPSTAVLTIVDDDPAFDYSLSNSGDITVTQGSSGLNTITRNLVSGTSQPVSLSVTSGLPTGATPNFTNNPCSPTCSSTLTISTSASTPAGNYTITVTGSPLSKTTTFGLVVNAAFNYSLSNSGNITVTQGSSGLNTVTATLVSGSSQSVSFTASGLPSGATASFSPTACTPTCSSTLTISTSGSTPAGTYPITVTGSPLGKTTTFNLVVNASFNYSLTNSGNITVTQGSSTSNTITRSLVSGATQSVTLLASGLPSGVSASFTNNPCSPTCSSTLTISTSASTPTGTHTITVTGTPLSKTTTFSLVVNASSFSLTVTIAGSASGTVTSDPAGINCGSDCSEVYAVNTSVTLTATAGSGASFKGWSGACSGTSTTCTVLMSAAKSATATFSKTYTDDPITSQSTLIKAVHITDLRQAINTLRSNNSLSAFSFADSTLTAGSTQVRKVHITELRTALDGVYDAKGLAHPTYTDSTITAGQTTIKKAHIAEIRQAVKDAE